jgi:hypothetical protein
MFVPRDIIVSFDERLHGDAGAQSIPFSEHESTAVRASVAFLLPWIDKGEFPEDSDLARRAVRILAGVAIGGMLTREIGAAIATAPIRRNVVVQ